MLSPRQETILKSIVSQYITRAKPVPSQSLLRLCELGVSPATIRNEMAQLEQEGYISRPHTSAGSVPSDKGYRYYVETIGEIHLPIADQRMVNRLFQQIEREVDEWLELATSILAKMVQNAVVITVPKPEASRFKRFELVRLQERVALAVLVLSGARLKEQLINFDRAITQSQLTLIANRLSVTYSGLTRSEISSLVIALSPLEEQLNQCLSKMMDADESGENARPYLNGLHYILNQPEFAHNSQVALSLMEMIEQQKLMSVISPRDLVGKKEVQVIIGKENQTEAIHDYSIVIGRYGLAREAAGTITVIGPTRMPYARTIATVNYLAAVLSRMISRLYEKGPPEPAAENTN